MHRHHRKRGKEKDRSCAPDAGAYYHLNEIKLFYLIGIIQRVRLLTFYLLFIHSNQTPYYREHKTEAILYISAAGI